jgi:hypothetical protein
MQSLNMCVCMIREPAILQAVFEIHFKWALLLCHTQCQNRIRYIIDKRIICREYAENMQIYADNEHLCADNTHIGETKTLRGKHPSARKEHSLGTNSSNQLMEVQ